MQNSSGEIVVLPPPAPVLTRNEKLRRKIRLKQEMRQKHFSSDIFTVSLDPMIEDLIGKLEQSQQQNLRKLMMQGVNDPAQMKKHIELLQYLLQKKLEKDGSL